MLNVYLSGEIHTNWREDIIKLCKEEDLSINFTSPITNHDASDNCGIEILGEEEKNFWKDNKGAKINSIKTNFKMAEKKLTEAVTMCKSGLDFYWSDGANCQNRPINGDTLA